MPRRRSNVNGLVAAATRVRLADRAAVKSAVKRQQTWQTDAWDYYDLVPVIKKGFRYVGNVMSKLTLYVAADNPDDPQGEPVPAGDVPGIDPQLVADAEAELGRLRSSIGGMATLAREYAINNEVAGECYLVGYGARTEQGVPGEPGYQAPTVERWEVRSVSEVVAKDQQLPGGRTSHVTVLGSPGDKTGIPLDPDLDTAIRLWQQHPRWSDQPDAEMKALLDDCEAFTILSRQVRAEGRSRLGSGILLVPSEITWSKATDPTADDDQAEAAKGGFMAALVEALTDPIEDEASPASLAPLVLRAPADQLKEVRRIDLSRESDATLDARIEARVLSMARGVNLPPERVLGHMDTTYANAEQIDQDEFYDYMEPRAQAWVDQLTAGFLHPQLLDPDPVTGIVRHQPDQVRRVFVWYDPEPLFGRERAVENADEGLRNGAISLERWAELKGFNPGDAPDALERVLQTVLTRGLFTGDVTAALLRELVGVEVDVPAQPGAGDAQPADPAAAAALLQLLTAALGGRRQGPPPFPVAAIEASAQAAERADLDALSRDMVQLDANLRDRLLVLADRTLTRALERAGAVMRSKVAEARTLVPAGTPAVEVGRLLGRTRVLAAGLTEEELLAEAFAAMRDTFMEWGAAAQAEALDLAAQATSGLSVAQRDALRLRQADDLAEAWTWLEQSMTSVARAQLYDPTNVGEVLGEFDPTAKVPAGVVREAMARAGGFTGVQTSGTDAWLLVGDGGNRPVGGIATGELVRGELAQRGVMVEAYEWVYGLASRRNAFEPHVRLGGVIFENFDDPVLQNMGTFPPTPFYAPGDHKGCLCDFRPVMVDQAQLAGRGADPLAGPGSTWQGQLLDGTADELDQARADLQGLRDLIEDDYASPRHRKGFAFTYDALGHAGPDSVNYVARAADGNLAGAIALDITEEGVYVNVLGSTFIEPGAGTELVRRAAQLAADLEVDLYGEPIRDAIPFWEGIGWKPRADGITWGFGPDDAARMAYGD